MGTLANSEDPDETQPNAAFHLGLHCLLGLKQHSGTKMSLKEHNGQSHTYCINMYEEIHQNTKG